MYAEARLRNATSVRILAWFLPSILTEQAAKDLLEERWQKVTAEKLPETSSLRIG
jgi:hypothetical protein